MLSNNINALLFLLQHFNKRIYNLCMIKSLEINDMYMGLP